MEFYYVVDTLNELLSKKRPRTFNSSWILRHAPECYRFIQNNIRTQFGSIDWDRVTSCLDSRHQRLWKPARQRHCAPYSDAKEVELVLDQYRGKLHVFIVCTSPNDIRMRDSISITLVRLAQCGNLLAKQELMELLRYTIDEWIDNDPLLSRWRGYEDEVQRQVEGCICRYRYTGSFMRYLYRTLECAGRGLRPLHAYSLDEPLPDGERRKIDLTTVGCAG